MANETMLEILTGGIPLETGLDYLWEIYVNDYRDGGELQKNQKCKLIELTGKKLELYDYADRKRYSYTLSQVIDRQIQINPKPLNSNKVNTNIETYLLTQALHFLNISEQMVSAILDGQSLDKNMLELHRHNIQETMTQIKNNIGKDG